MTALSARVLNRTLWGRQQLLSRGDATVAEMTHHLIGLQAQETLPPYLSLNARLASFDPHEVTAGLQDRSLVRLRTLRGTLHLLVAADALCLRTWTAPVDEREIRAAPNVAGARDVDRAEFLTVLRDLLSDGPLTQTELGAALAEHFAGHAPAELGRLARSAAPLVQVPPRGTWRGSGAVTYQYADRWLGRAMTEPDVPSLVRRFLAAYGPASAADLSTWSGVTRLGPVVAAMDDLVRHRGPNGRILVDLPDADLVDEDVATPVRLLGTYDNLWLSHAGRDRVTRPHQRRAWSGANGAVANTVFVDGLLEGLWRVDADRVVSLETFRTLTRRERSELDDEITRVEALLAIPPAAAQA